MNTRRPSTAPIQRKWSWKIKRTRLIPNFWRTSLAINGTTDIKALNLAKDGEELVKKLLVAALNISGLDKPFVKGLRERIKEWEHVTKIAGEETIYLEDPITTRRADA